MKKGEIYEGIIESVDFPNKGRVPVGDTVVTVKNGIPGQRVRFMINKKRGERVEGRLMEILEPSPLQIIAPVCQTFPACGGCMYQTMDYTQQLNMKAKQVQALLSSCNYCPSAGFSVRGHKKQPSAVGLSEQNGIFLWRCRQRWSPDLRTSQKRQHL